VCVRSQNLRLKNRVHVGAMWTATCLDEVSEVVRAPDRSVVMGWPMTNVVATFDTADIKQQFETKLIRCQQHYSISRIKSYSST